MKAKEFSSCCCKVCCVPALRTFDLDVKLPFGTWDKGNDDGLVFRLHREYTCTFLCCNRPEVTVSNKDNGQDTVIGKIVDPCLVCSIGVDIFDDSNNLIYTIRAGCC